MEFPHNTDITFKLCTICQTQTDEEYVEKPRFTQKTIRCNSGKISLWRCEVSRGAVLFERLFM